jgi:DNA-binding MarR family transcriptional regulator
MNSLELFLLGRKLAKLGEDSIPSSGLQHMPTSVKLVLFDVFDHPETTIGEISERTGLLQSQVSSAVARFREQGAFETRADPNDRRRTLLNGKREVARRGAVLHYEPVDAIIAEATGADNADELEKLTTCLEKLATRLIPNALSWTRSKGDSL